MLQGFLTGATWWNVVWCMYGSLISFIRDMWGLKRVHKREYLHLRACIRKHVSLDVDACVHLCFSARARPWHVCACQHAYSHLYICICTLKTLASELQQRRDVMYCWQSRTTDTMMTFENSDTCTAVAEIKGGTHFWLPATVCFPPQIYIQRHRFEVNVGSECVCVHLVPEYRLHPFYRCINHQHSMPSSPSTAFKH